MSTAVAKLAKPQMRGYVVKRIQRTFVEAFTLATLGSMGWYFYVVKPRKDAYREFYANHDPDKEFERMRKAGVFKCCPVDEEE